MSFNQMDNLSVSDAEASMAPVSVVILTWNGLEFTKPCLDSVLKHTDLSKVDVIVVDNGSTDGTVEYLSEVPGIVTIFNGDNLGFVRGNNEALRRIDASHDVILLNNDTEIDDPRWIEKLRGSAYSGGNVGVVGCRIRRLTGGMLQHAGTYIPDRSYWGQQLGAGEKDINQYPYDREVEGVVFACVYIRRALMDEIGYLDEDFFSYYEDSDYCFKARRAGYRVVNCGSLTVRHREHGSTSVNKVSHSDMFLKSQETFLGKWKTVLDARYSQRLHLRSTFFQPVGYAMTARQIALGLDEQGVSISYEYLYGPGTVFPVAESAEQSTGVYSLEIIRQRAAPEAPTPTLIYGQADSFNTVKGGYRIGYTMLETTGVPTDWVEGCNGLDELWVPTEFNKWTFSRSGVTVPIKVMPLGLVDTNYFNPEIAGLKIEGVFSFLSIFEWGERKSPEILIRAFNRAFRSTDPVVLICKYTNRDPGVRPDEIIRSLKLDPDGGRIVYSENESVPYYQVAQLYRSSDCFVLPTRGEGWGMPILEAMACGIPVIASYWSAQQSFLDNDNSYPLQVSLVDAEAKCPYYLGFKWALPDEDHLIRLFRHVFENQEQARAKGRQAAIDVAEHWSLTRSSQRMKQRIVEISKSASNDEGESAADSATLRDGAIRPRIGFDVSRAIGSELSGVGRYTASLVKGLSHWQSEHGREVDYLMLPGFADFVHPAYVAGEESDFSVKAGSGMTMYRGPLPAFKDADRAVPGLDALYCTGNAFPAGFNGKAAMVVYDTTFLSHPQFHTEENIALCTSNFDRAVASGAHFVAISENTKRDFIKYYRVEPSRVTTIACGVDLSLFKPASAVRQHSVRQRHNLPDKYFLYVGSIEPRKNLRSLLKAMKSYRGEESLVVVGASGWLNDDVKKLMVAAGGRVKMLGYVPLDDMPALYSMATAFVYPSLYEGFGLPVVEAMACGVPVITSRNSSLLEIGEGASLLLDNPEDSDEIARGLQRIAEDPAFAQGLRESGSARALNFSLDVQVRRHVEFFRNFIAGES
ncbi:glycosyltransferase [Lysobacter capsici]|uniref:glycosyltransferase n=1 Tax=Lysobacter capsici TaxID=435897 RepID=UPI001BFFFFDE|nr:glycosyltransferase [Lysobacter capsici]QWF16146.1 glycosyltransferase [Lysobacter capsici]